MTLSPLLLVAAPQGEPTGGGETTGIVQQVGEAGQKVGQEAESALQVAVGDLFAGVLSYLTSTTFLANVIAAATVVVLAVAFYRGAIQLVPHLLTWRRPEENTTDAAALARKKRQDTAATLVRNALRYGIFAIVTLFLFSIFFRNTTLAIGGTAVAAAIIGFSAQSFLRDIIAGFFILFEGQYSVGDFIEVEPTKASGLVEEFGLRTTQIRALSGEIIYIPNGSLTGVTNYVSGQQRFTIEVQLKDEEAAKRVLEEMQEVLHELYLTPPRLVKRDATPGGGPRLTLLADVLPSTAWLVEENLVERIKAAAGEDGLAADPLVYKVDSRNVRRIREFIPPE